MWKNQYHKSTQCFTSKDFQVWDITQGSSSSYKAWRPVPKEPLFSAEGCLPTDTHLLPKPLYWFPSLASEVPSGAYLSSFCIVERSSSQFKVSSLPALEGAGLFHQHPLFYDSLQKHQKRGVKHRFYWQARFLFPQHAPVGKQLKLETNNLSALCWKRFTDSFSKTEQPSQDKTFMNTQATLRCSFTLVSSAITIPNKINKTEWAFQI